ncbi:hypothetical protein CJ030_MR0G025668 [Morella rubra]|uniref:Reverse transcriptase domain-containing protein n=1 Tax=Morella rubra TaxID=262757 RepID=A0A6A1UF16_9ROSI|nr:hypothetical protein CJ030_MR0G025668 [Morella rubra]
MEAFSCMMSKMVSVDVIKGFRASGVNREGECVSHLLFVDDTLIFCGAEEYQFCSLHCMLFCFEAVSGLKINLAKSEVIPVGDVSNVGELASILGCRVSALPMTYLGLSFGARFKSVRIWDEILKRMERRLVGGKRMYFSKGGHVTLIKSTLSCLPTYFLSLFPLPHKVACRMEKLKTDSL